MLVEELSKESYNCFISSLLTSLFGSCPPSAVVWSSWICGWFFGTCRCAWKSWNKNNNKLVEHALVEEVSKQSYNCFISSLLTSLFGSCPPSAVVWSSWICGWFFGTCRCAWKSWNKNNNKLVEHALVEEVSKQSYNCFISSLLTSLFDSCPLSAVVWSS